VTNVAASGGAPAHLPPYDIVIATRNRFDALVLSMPLMLGQVPPPARIVVVDSSDDVSALPAALAALSKPAGVEVRIVRSDPGLPHQRNVGLGHVVAPIVFFPDDDALWHPGFALHVLEVYARDHEGRVGGVGGTEDYDRPDLPSTPQYRQTRSTRLIQRLTPRYHELEERLFAEPRVLAGRALMSRHTLPDWVDGDDIVAVDHVTGFRMSFRTSVIRRLGFDETLTGYALSEDVDASLGVWHEHLLLAHHGSRVLHYKRPGGRENGWRDGYLHIVNYVYVVAKHAPIGSPARRRMVPWAVYRSLMYAARIRGRPSWQRFLGALAAVPAVRGLAAIPDTPAIQRRYLALFARAMSREGA
jgi:glycosyltransferase involved in cell wall biosynthesis